MDRVTDTEACTNCGHDHFPMRKMSPYDNRREECLEPGCDCTDYEAPKNPKVRKCGRCQRMVTRVWSSCWGGGYTCDDCYGPF